MKGDKLPVHMHARPLISLATEQHLCMKAWGWQPLPKIYCPPGEATMKATAASTGSQLVSPLYGSLCSPTAATGSSQLPSLVLQAEGEPIHLRKETQCPHAVSQVTMSG